MIRGNEDGMVDWLLVGAPLVADVALAVTMLDSCASEVSVLVLVGLMV